MKCRGEEVNPAHLVCVGSAHWDVVSRIPIRLRRGSDVPGEVVRMPGGVALNVARSLQALGGTPLICSVVGDDIAGRELVSSLAELGIPTEGVHRKEGANTDSCVVILDSLNSATVVADCRLLEREFGMMLEFLNRLAYTGNREFELAIDGNLPEPAVDELFSSTELKRLRKRYVVASDGKATRARALIGKEMCTVHLNLKEAGLVAARAFGGVSEAATHLVQLGFERAIVTSARGRAADCGSDGLVSCSIKSRRQAVRILGAGDRLVAAHFLAEQSGCSRNKALDEAVRAASDYVAGEFAD